MSLVSALKNLLVPVKSSNDTTALDIDWRAIEIWGQQVVAAIKSISGGSGYASLTGPGQTTSPGALTQDGDFTVEGELIVDNPSDSSQSLTIDPGTSVSGQVVFTFSGLNWTLARNGLQITSQNLNLFDSATPTFQGATGLNLFATAGIATLTAPTTHVHATNDVNIDTAASGSINIGLSPGTALNKLGFFGVTAVAQQASAGITTVAQLVTVLQNYGLLS